MEHLRFESGRLLASPAESPTQLLAAVADYRLAIDLQPAPQIGVLGVVLFQRQDRPGWLGISQPIPGRPSGALLAEHCGLALTLGPSYKEADGAWTPLAGMPSDWADIRHDLLAEAPERVEFEIEYRIGGGPTLWERYRLQADGLAYETRIRWVVGGFRLQLPVFLTDGKLAAVPRLEQHRLTVVHENHALHAEADDPTVVWEIDTQQYVNRVGLYQNAYLQGRSAVRYGVRLSID